VLGIDVLWLCKKVAYLTMNCFSSWCYVQLCEIFWYYHKWTVSGISLSVFQIVQNYLFEQIFQHDAGEHDALLHFVLCLHVHYFRKDRSSEKQ